ncbi:MAG: tape measure protein [Hyphomonadaceae bacterium]
MATDVETLILQMDADLRAFQKSMIQAAGEADKAAQRIERRFEQQNKKIAQDFNRFSDQVRGVLAAIGVGVVVRDVTSLGDKWIRVGNALAFAGIEADQLASTQQLVADIASSTRSDLEATADLFARMLRSSNDLGASLADVAADTEIVSKALAGASQSERAGAIRQLGQGLGSGRLQGDELRSILENSRPISDAIAKEFNTTVGNLRKLGQQGELESRRVFEAILKAGPEIDAAYARTTFTVADAFTKLETEATRFIGTNERTSSSTRALADLITYTADNFDTLAAAVVVTASVVGGGFAGVAVARAVQALTAMIGAMGAAEARALTLKNALAFFGGPLGIALTAAGAGLAYLATQTDVFVSKSAALQRAADSSYSALQRMVSLSDELGELSEGAGAAADSTGEIAAAAADAQRAIDGMGRASDGAADHLSTQERLTNALASAERKRTIDTLNAAIADERAGQAAIRRARFMQGLFDVINSAEAAFSGRAFELSDDEKRQIEESNQLIATFQGGLAAARDLSDETWKRLSTRGSGRAGGGGGGGGGGGAAHKRDIEDLTREAELSLARLRHETERVQQLEDATAIEKRANAYEAAGMAAALARATAEREVTAERQAQNAETERQLALSQLQDASELARARHQIALADSLADEVEIRRRAAALADQTTLSQAEAAAQAREYVEALREAAEIDRQHNLDLRDLNNQLELARAAGDDRAEQAINRRLELERRIAELRDLGIGEDAVLAQAQAEVDALEQADFQGKFRNWFTGGVMAALDNDLGDFFQNWLQERARAGLTDALNSVADIVFRLFNGTISSALGGKTGGGVGDIIGAALGSLFGGGKASGGPVSPGHWYNVGENGPEKFVPAVPGFIVPNGISGGALNLVMNDYRTVNFQGNSEEFQQLKAFMAQDRLARRSETIAIVNDAVRRRQVGRR